MPTVTFVERYPHPPAVLFAFFRRPANVLAVGPPDLDVRLLEGPEQVSAGDRFAVQARRFGLSRRIDTEVVEADEPSLLVERQVQGPFARWQLERRFVAVEGGAELTETIHFEPPGGLLGLTLTAAAIEEQLRHAYHNRAARVLARLGGTPEAE